MGRAPVYSGSDREGRETIESALFVILSLRLYGSIAQQMSLFLSSARMYFADLARTRHS